MRNARFGLMAALAGATLCLFAVTSYGQNTNTPTGAAGTGGTDQGTAAQPSTGTATAPTTDATVTRTTATDVSTTTTTFPGGVWGIVGVVVLVLIVLFAVFRGRDRTVIRETYASSSASTPAPRSTGAATAADDRARAASGTGTTSDGMNDPNTRR